MTAQEAGHEGNVLVKALKARFHQELGPIEVEEDDVLQPKGTEVVIRTTHAGICHSDVHCWEGFLDLGEGHKWHFPTAFPRTCGHEILGTVFATGDEVKGAEIGDNVLVYPWVGCGECDRCQSETGDEHLCVNPFKGGTIGCGGVDGGFGEYVTVPHPRYLFRTDGIPPDVACLLPCSVLTAYCAVKKAFASAPPGNGVCVMIGSGGLGLAAMQLAMFLHPEDVVVAVDVNDQSLEFARQLGVKHTVNSKETDVCDYVKNNLTLPVKSVVDFVGSSITASVGAKLCQARGATMVMVGLHGGRHTVSLAMVPMRALTITGTFVGGRRDQEELIKLLRDRMLPQDAFQTTVSKKISQGGIDQAMRDLQSGKIRGRCMIEYDRGVVEGV